MTSEELVATVKQQIKARDRELTRFTAKARRTRNSDDIDKNIIQRVLCEKELRDLRLRLGAPRYSTQPSEDGSKRRAAALAALRKVAGIT